MRDGVIGDPLACRFDPKIIVCDKSQTGKCITTGQAVAAARIYAGPTTSAGIRLAAGGPPPGSELGWMEIADDTFPNEFFRSAFKDDASDGFPAAKFDFNHDYKRLGLAGTAIDSNPDLRRFREAGGKLLIVQGGNDTTEQPPVVVDHFQMVERIAGGLEATERFARLFIVPGMNHATGGDGAFAIDYLSAIERWVKDGQSPALLVAAHVPEWSRGYSGMVAGLTAPDNGQFVTFTLPVYPYLQHARYKGVGNANDWRSFRPAAI